MARKRGRGKGESTARRSRSAPPTLDTMPEYQSRSVIRANTEAALAIEANAARGERFRLWIDRVARNSPARLTLATFAAIICVITALLALPVSTRGDRSTPIADVIFTAVSTVSVTGLTTVDTATHWSTFGQVVILLGINIGGLGVMTMASILGLAVSRHLGLSQRMLLASQTGSSNLGEVGSLLRSVLIISVSAEILIFLVLVPRFLSLGESFGSACWQALFVAVSVFNNAGFLILPEGLSAYVGDWWMITPIIVGGVVGALGFPVISDLVTNWRRPRRLALHTKLTLSTYGALVVLGAVLLGWSEWTNPRTLGGLDLPTRILNSLLASVNTRSSGMTTLDVDAMDSSTWFLQDIFMFIGGGSASTAGGIKVTTFAVLALAVIAEARGDRDIEAYGRRIPFSTVRLVISVTCMGALLVAVSTLILLIVTDFTLDQVLFEAISAFATVGLSTGITSDLPDVGKYVLAALMFAGRTGTMTFAAALALRERPRVVRMPEERPIIG